MYDPIFVSYPIGNVYVTLLISRSAWIAWFPLLFYSTLYVGDLYKRTVPYPSSPEEEAALDAETSRLGSRALFYSSLVSLLVNFVLPAFVTEAADNRRPSPSQQPQSRWESLFQIPRGLQIQCAISHVVYLDDVIRLDWNSVRPETPFTVGKVLEKEIALTKI